MDYLILFVDDDADIRDTIHDLLQFEGYLCTVCANGMEAYDMLQAGLVPALIMTDIMMPVMDGFELMERISIMPALENVPIICATASTTLANRAHKMCHKIAKPFDLDNLLVLIHKLIGGPNETQSRTSSQSNANAGSSRA